MQSCALLSRQAFGRASCLGPNVYDLCKISAAPRLQCRLRRRSNERGVSKPMVYSNQTQYACRPYDVKPREMKKQKAASKKNKNDSGVCAEAVATIRHAHQRRPVVGSVPVGLLIPYVGHLAVFVVGPAQVLVVPIPDRPGGGKQVGSEK